MGGFPSGATGFINAVAGIAAPLLGGPITNAVTSVANALGAGGPGRQLSFLCKAASLPPSQIGPIVVPFRGRQLKVPGDRVFPEWQITVINDTSFQIRDAFEKWMNGMNDHISNTGALGLTLAQDWKVQQLSRQGGEVLRTYNFSSCWPSEVGPIELSYDNTDTIEEYTVTLNYQYWTADIANTTGVLGALGGVFGGGGVVPGIGG